MRHLRPLLLLFAFSLPLFAQKATRANNQFPLVQVNVSGSQRYSPQAIIAALGLHTGQPTTQKDLEDASQRLGNSGLFSLVQFRFGWAGNGVVANYDLTDNPKLVPIAFENLVWFSPNELTTAIKKKLPLFTGVVPLSGDYRDGIRDAIKQILTEKNLQGEVIALPHGPLNGEVQSMLYKVEGNEIRITACDFSGAEHADKTALAEFAKYLSQSSYEKSFVDAAIPTRLKDIYDAQGYLAARFDLPELKIVSVAPDHTDVALTTHVAENSQYTLAGVQWAGNSLYKPEELTIALKLQPGQIASVPKFRDQLSVVRRLYGHEGYIGVKMDFVPILSTDNTAQFKVTLREGTQYRLGVVQFNGIDQLTAGKILSTWKMKTGQVYDDNYPRQYMTLDFGKYAPQHFKWEWRIREVINDETKVVDLQIDIEFKPSNSK